MIYIFILTLLVSCSGRQNPPRHTDVFTYRDNNTGDTIKYYGFKDLDTALFHAKSNNKKVLVIFSGYSCLAIGGQEWRTLSLYTDRDKIHEEFVIAWLAVDDQSTVFDTTQTVFWYGKQRRLISMGDKNKFFQESLFNSSTQPFYAFLDIDKKPIGQTLTYTKTQADVDAFVNSGLTK